MKTSRYRLIAYLAVAPFTVVLALSCGNCDDGNNFEDQEAFAPVDSLSVVK